MCSRACVRGDRRRDLAWVAELVAETSDDDPTADKYSKKAEQERRFEIAATSHVDKEALPGCS